LYSFESWKLNKNKNVKPLVKTHFWLISSTFEWLSTLFYFESNSVLIINAVSLYIVGALSFFFSIYFFGVWGLMKYYILPLVAYHIVMSIFLKVNDEISTNESGVFGQYPLGKDN
jgi:hypothetical protein